MVNAVNTLPVPKSYAPAGITGVASCTTSLADNEATDTCGIPVEAPPPAPNEPSIEGPLFPVLPPPPVPELNPAPAPVPPPFGSIGCIGIIFPFYFILRWTYYVNHRCLCIGYRINSHINFSSTTSFVTNDYNTSCNSSIVW